MEKRIRFIVFNIGLFLLLVILTPVVFSLSTLINFHTGSKILSLAVLPIYALISGHIFSKIFDNYGSNKIIISGVIGSLVFAGVSGIQKVIFNSLNQISQTTSSLQGGKMSGIVNTEAMFNPELLFPVFLLSFNAPIIYSIKNSEELELKYLLLYIIPLLIYLIIPAIFSGFV